MSTISAGTTLGTALVLSGDTNGNLVVKTGASATTAATFDSGGTVTLSSVTAFTSGTASAPAITTTGDTDTGIYFPTANETAVTTGGTVAAAFNSNGLFFRNRIINGDMRIDQRNAGASITPTSGQYTVDRWTALCTQASKYSTQQNAGSVTPPTGFSNYLGITSLSAYSVLTGDTFLIDQRIEGFNFSDMEWGTANARTITFSFWVRSSLTGTFGGALANSASNRSYTFSYTIISANTWEYKTITVPGDTTGTWVGSTNGIGVIVRFGLGSGSTYTATANSWAAGNFVQPPSTTSVVGTNGATLYITGVQLETGSVATPFERRPFGTELMLCQRYFTRFNGSALDRPWCVSAIYDSTTAYGVIPLPVTMRADPTITFSGSTVLRLLALGTGFSASASSAGNVTPQAFEVYGTYSGLTQGGSWMRASGASQWIAASAEL